MCSIRTKHMAYHTHDRPTACTPTACTFAQRNQCRLAGQQDTQTWHQLRQHVTDVLQAEHETVSPEVAIQRIHDNVSTEFHKLFSPKNTKLCAVDYTAFHHHIEDKWFHKKRLRQLAKNYESGLHSVFQAWHHRSRYQSLQRDQQRMARQAKKTQFNQLCTEAAAAAKIHDTHSTFLIINKFTPKKPLARTLTNTWHMP